MRPKPRKRHHFSPSPTFPLAIHPINRPCSHFGSLFFSWPPLRKGRRGMLLIRDVMEIDTKISHFNEERPKGNCTRVNERNTQVDNGANTSTFLNHGAVKWDESRKKWVGDQSQKPVKVPKDPILSWSLTYDDLLSTNDPFPEPIPLPEMVDFLVDIWHDEDHFD